MTARAAEACPGWEADRDTLTGLPGRNAVLRRLSAADADAGRRRRPALLLLDLDSFQTINESLGDEAGDQLLIAVSQRLAQALPPDAILGRWDGDRFAVLLPEITQTLDAVRAADGLIAALHAPFALGGRAVEVAASIGVAPGGENGESAGALLHRAERALGRAKADGGGRYVLAAIADAQAKRRRAILARDLWAACERDQMRLYYQPTVDLSTGTIIGVEALARWQHPVLGLIYPNEFIPLAQELGVIRTLGGWVLSEACRQVSRWRQDHPRAPRLSVGVNLSPAELRNPNLIAQVATILRESALSPSNLQLEVGETTLMSITDESLETLHALRRLGVRLALDDFGSGCSSLRRLGHLPMSTLKIDRTLMDEMGRSTESMAVVRSVIALAHALNMDVTGEGFETAAQLNRMRDAACDHGQGFYFSEPLPDAAMTELLADVLP